MRKFTLIAALLTTTTCAHAGNSISFEIDGHKVRIEASKNCDQLSCLKISGVDLKGFDSKRLNSSRFDGDDDAAVKSDSPAQKPSPAPTVQATSPQAPTASAATAATAAPAAPAPVASTSPQPAVKDEGALPAPASASSAAKPAPVAAAPVQANATPIGVWPPKTTRARCASKAAGNISADMPSRAAKKS